MAGRASGTQGEASGAPQRSVVPKLVIGAIIAVVVIVFIVQNSSKGEIHLLLWRMSAPRWLGFVILVGIGFVLGSIFPWFRRRNPDAKR
jgi:uncharacterized integral membrane protein